jgi:predicted GH43/DUF377 family glycosyl hydrolase
MGYHVYEHFQAKFTILLIYIVKCDRIKTLIMRNSVSVVIRYNGNPILTRDNVPYPVETVHNAGIAKYEDKYIMLFRSHLRNGRSIIGLAESEDGYQFKVHQEPFIIPSTEGPFTEYEEFGIEDPRISVIDGNYFITYSAYSRYGGRIALAKTSDFKGLEKIALITPTDMRNIALFPEKFDGKYVRLDRPHSETFPWSIWISYSPDLIHWGESRIIMKPIEHHWDEIKVGQERLLLKLQRDGFIYIMEYPKHLEDLFIDSELPYMIYLTLQKLLGLQMTGFYNLRIHVR